MISKRFIPLWLSLVAAIFIVSACSDGDSSTKNSDGGSDGDSDGDTDGDSDGDTDGDSDGDSDGDTDGDTDGDSDGDGDCPDVAWGSGLEIGQIVANWTQSGYIDSDGDGTVEQTEVNFSLDDIHCDVQSIVLIIGAKS